MKQRCIFLAVLLSFLTSAQRVAAQPPPRLQSVTVQTDGSVLFRFRDPSATTVNVGGSYPISTKVASKMKDVAMTKDANGIWTARVGPLKPDIYEYHFIADGMPLLDPSNQAHITGDSNWFILPGAASYDYEVHDVPHGRVSLDWYPSPSLGLKSRRMAIYTPAEYQGGGSKRYPVLYLMHWGGGDELGPLHTLRLAELMDNLIAQGKVVPMIVVMPNSNTRQALAPGDAPTPGPNERPGPRPDYTDLAPYTDSVLRDVLPFVDRNYRTFADRDHRAAAGFSLGGTHALITVLDHLDQFSWLGSMSGGLDALPGLSIKVPSPPDAATRRGAPSGQSIDPAKFALLFPSLGPAINNQLHLFYIGIGDSDGLLEGWQAARKVFDEKNVRYVWLELPDYGHDGSTWRVMLLDFLPKLFQAKR